MYDLEIIGEVPRDLDGAFFRVAPDAQYPPRSGHDIFFNGDGSVAQFRFTDGHIDFRQRYIATPRYLMERQARSALFGAYRNPYTDDPRVRGLSRTTGNTNVVVHNGVLWGLREDSLPVAMDPVTLETLGLSDFGGVFTGETFTAHPKVDPATGRMHAFGYAAKGDCGTDMVYAAISADGKVEREVWFHAPYPGMTHDMGLTEHYAVFAMIPQTYDDQRIRNGGIFYQWQPGVEVMFGVLPLDGAAEDVRWFRAPHGFVGHTINAFESGGRIHFDAGLTHGNVFPFFPPANGEVINPGDLPSEIVRFTIDPRGTSDTVTITELSGTGVEFPHIDDRYAGQDYRHAFMLGVNPAALALHQAVAKPANLMFNTLLHLDAHTGSLTSWAPGPANTLQEPVFVRRSATAPEGDGWVILLVNRLAEVRSDLVILDSTRIEDGPLAVARLPFRLKNGIHGNWADATEFTGAHPALTTRGDVPPEIRAAARRA